MMQDAAASMSRNPTARTSAERSAQKESALTRFSPPGLMVTTRKIAERVSGEETSCETGSSGADAGALMGSDAIGICRRLPTENRSSSDRYVHGAIRGIDSLSNDGEWRRPGVQE